MEQATGASWADTAAEVLLVLVLAVAVATDLRWRRIPDWLTLPALAVLVALSFRRPAGPVHALLGLAVGLLPLLLTAAAGWMGRGDAMLMGVVGAFSGVPQVLGMLLFVTLAGGVQGLAAVAARTAPGRRLCERAGMKGARDPDFARTVPYGIAIAAGTYAGLLFVHLEEAAAAASG